MNMTQEEARGVVALDNETLQFRREAGIIRTKNCGQIWPALTFRPAECGASASKVQPISINL